MATLPLKYCEQIKDALRYVDDYKVRNVQVYVTWNSTVNCEVYDIYHYDTFIVCIVPKTDAVQISGDAYSASDRDIINSFLMLYGMSKRVSKNVEGLYIR